MDSAQLAAETHRDQDQEQQRQDPDRLLGEHGERDRKPGPEREARGEHVALHHDDPGEHEQRAREPGEVVVVDRSREVLRLGEQRDQRRGSRPPAPA